MALKSETLLQMPPVVLGGTSNSIDEKPSKEEDLEDGEIFDDEDDNVESEATGATSSDTGKKQSDVGNNNSAGSVQINCVNSDGKNSVKNSVILDSKTSAITKTTTLATADSNSGINLKNELSSGYMPPWKNSNPSVTSASDGLQKKQNLYNEDDKRSSREKKKKRKRLKDGDDDKHGKEKRAKKNSDKDKVPDSNNHPNHHDDNKQPAEDDNMEDDDEMLFIRGASPTMHNYNNSRHHRSSRDEEDERIPDDEEDDYLDDEDEEYNDEDEDDDEERRKLRLNDPCGRLDRAARRERLSARGKRRGRGGANCRDGNNKRRKDDGEICIFYLQGKCHKGGECPFSHDAMPHKKMELCKFYLMDCCNKKDKCLYMHSEFPCKYFHMGLKCYANKNCKFSHAKMSEAMRQVFIKTFGPINNRTGKEFPNKKGSSNKYRQQDGQGDFSLRGRENRRGGDGNKRGGGTVGGVGGGGGGGSLIGGPGGPEKKIPSLFDIKVSIPTEMRNNANNNGNNSDSDGNHTPMPSPQHMLHMSDSSRSPPPLAMSPTMQLGRKRRKERKSERSKKTDKHRSDKSENKRMPLLIMNNDTNWDDMMLEHQRLQQQFLAESCGNFAEDSDPNDNDDDGQCRIAFNQFTSSVQHHDIFSNNSNHSGSNNSSSKNNNCNNVDDSCGGVSDTISSSLQRSPSPLNDSDTGGALQIVTQSNDNSYEMFPVHLPKKQRELFLRIKQQQRQAEDSGNNGSGNLQIAEDGDDSSNEVNTTMTRDKNDSSLSSNTTDKKNKNNDDNCEGKLKQHDENWYSSDEEDEQQPSSGTSSLTVILQNLVRMNSNTDNKTTSSLTTTQSSSTSSNSFNNIQPSPLTSTSSSSSSAMGSSNITGSNGVGVNNINPTGISNVDFDINEVSELLSKVKQHFQANNEKKMRDPRLSRSDVGPSGDSPDGSGGLNSPLPNTSVTSLDRGQNQGSPPTSVNEDVDLRVNPTGYRGVGGGDMDLRNLPFKPAPVHSAATEIDASINSHSPLPYRLIPVVAAKPDYSSIPTNTKAGAADPRLRKNLRVSEESSSAVSSRDPRHRLLDNVTKEKTIVPPVQNSDPRQRARAASSGNISMPPTTMPEEPQLPPSLMLSHLRATFTGSLMQNPGGPDMGMMCPPTPRMDDDLAPPPNFMPTPVPTRPTDPRQRHSQPNLPPTLPSGVQLPPSLFEAMNVMNAMQNAVRQPNFLSQAADPRSRPPGVPNMPNVVFPGAVRSNDPINRGQYGFKQI